MSRTWQINHNHPNVYHIQNLLTILCVNFFLNKKINKFLVQHSQVVIEKMRAKGLIFKNASLYVGC